MKSLVSISVVWGVMLLGSAVAGTISVEDQADLYQLEQLHGAFHHAASVRNNVTGDSQEVIDDRITEILSLWTKDAVLTVNTGSPVADGHYIGRGDLNTDCPMPSGNPKNQGTICSLFRYLAGYFQPQNKWISLTSAFKQNFKILTSTSAHFYFECHYFDVDDSTGTPPWTAEQHAALGGTAIKVNGQWRFWKATASVAGVPTAGGGY